MAKSKKPSVKTDNAAGSPGLVDENHFVGASPSVREVQKKKMRGIGGYIFDHFSNTTYVRSPEQLEREEWLIPGVIRFSRWLLMLAALVIQLCVGSLYAWSGYNLPIEAAVLGVNGSIDRNQASITFYIAVAVFGCAAAVLGPWLERNGPFRGTLLGACLFYLGNLLAGLGVFTKQMWLVYVGYGVVGGMGLGIGYISPVSPLQKWFPEMRGIAAGLAVCGFGGGSIIAPFTQLALIGPNFAKTGEANLGVPLTFVILGSFYFVLMIAAGLVLRMPPPGYQVKGITIDTIRGAENLSSATITNDKAVGGKTGDTPTVPKSQFSLTLLESLGSREFVLMYAMFFGSQMTGLLLISKIQSIIINQLGQSATLAAGYNAGLSAMNLAGRLLLPLISDFVGRKPLFIISLAVQAILLGFLPTAIHERSLVGVVVCAFIIGFFYGAGFGIIPAFLADQFGSKNVGATHGMILTSWSMTGVVGVLVFNQVLSLENTRLMVLSVKENLVFIYDINLRWVLAVVCAAFFVCLFIPVNIRDRKLPKVDGEKLRFRLITGRMCRYISGKGFVTVSKDEEESEWNAFLAAHM